MNDYFDFVIIGGGMAGVTAAQALRNEGEQGSIAILSNEALYPYQRPPLSKGTLRSTVPAQPKFILEPSKFVELKIDVLLDSTASRIDPAKHLVWLAEDKKSIHYKKLLIASGVKPNHLEIAGSTLEGIYYLHSFDNAQSIQVDAQQYRSVVVIGGSFVGLELAASLAQKGLKVTLIERDHLLGLLHIPMVSEYVKALFEKHGVRVILDDEPIEFVGVKHVSAVRTKKSEVIDCELVVIGAGVEPDIDFLQGSGVKTDNGVLVDRYLQTNRANIFAAGDVANFYDTVFSRRQRIEHWDNAVKQGRIAALNMLGQKIAYEEVPYFYSDIFEISFNVLGFIDAQDEQINRGSIESGSFATFFLRDGIPQALFSLGRPSEETKVMESLIKHKVNLRSVKDKLSDSGFALLKIPTQTILILQGGGAFGAFECGALKAFQESAIHADIIAGVSIGAFNGAVIAGNPDRPVQALEAFWNDLAVRMPNVGEEQYRRMQACNQIAAFGVPNFFKPRWLMPFASFNQLPNQWTSFYDTSSMKELLEKHIDFDKLKSSPIRLMVSAVDVETSELVIFDSYMDHMRPEHIMASGSLPPAFPWTTINGRHYWDGGIVSNSPLEQVIDRCGSAGKQVFIVDLFPRNRANLPENILDVMSRRDEILYSERIRSDLKIQNLMQHFRQLVNQVIGELPAEKIRQIQHLPNYIQLMAEESPMKIVRITREDPDGEPAFKDYDFSDKSIEQLQQAGYAITKKSLNK